MSKSNRPSSGRTNQLLVAIIFLIFLMISISIILFTVFKAKNPKVIVNAVQLPTFSISNGTVNFTFSQYVSVRNPNRAVFSPYGSTLQLLYAGNEVGFTSTSAGKVGARRTQDMAINLSVPSFAFETAASSGPTLEIVSRMEMAGRVRVLGLLTRHVEAKADCTSSIAVGNGSVERFYC